MKPDYETVERLAAELCARNGGDWHKKYTKVNLWRCRAMAIWHLARGEEAEAREVMKGARRA
jgi:hypothetical protein